MSGRAAVAEQVAGRYVTSDGHEWELTPHGDPHGLHGPRVTVHPVSEGVALASVGTLAHWTRDEWESWPHGCVLPFSAAPLLDALEGFAQCWS